MGVKKDKSKKKDKKDKTEKVVVPKTRQERLTIVSEVKWNLSANNLGREKTVVEKLYPILDDYVANGTVSDNVEIPLELTGDMPRKFIIMLRNERGFRDQVLIRAKDDQDEN